MLLQRLFAAGMTAGLVGYAAFTLGTEASVSSHPGEAAGTVVDVNHAYRAPDTVTVEFQVGERTVRAEIEEEGYEVGDEVRIEYDTAHPTRARIKGSHFQAIAGLLFGGVGLVFLYAVFNPRWAFRRRD